MREGTEPDGSTSQPQQISYPRDVPAPLFGEGVDFDLHDEVRMYRELLRSMPVAVYFKDVDTNFVDVNTFHAEAIGRPSNELIGLSDQDIYPETEAELYYGADRRVIDEGATIDGLIENNSGFQGTVVQNATSKFPVRNASGDIVGMMGFAIDVASSSGALEKLKESELRYALAMRATSEGIWDYDVAADSSSISPRAAQLLNCRSPRTRFLRASLPTFSIRTISRRFAAGSSRWFASARKPSNVSSPSPPPVDHVGYDSGLPPSLRTAG